MQYPDFCESQLQELYNSEFARLWPHKPPGYFPPVVVSLPQEKHKGWDTGYNLPWLGKVNPKNNFCNLFIQYKLSYICDHPMSGEYDSWNEPYFRFMIPHQIESYGGRRNKYSHHQFEALRKLSEDGFAVSYATNSTIYWEQLFDWALKEQITQMCPLLDVSDLHEQHRYVTFTKDSDYFLLHSELYKTGRMSYEIVRSKVLEAKRSSLEEDLRILPRTLSEYPEFRRSYQFYIREYAAESVQARWLILHYLVSVLLGITWIKLAMD